MNETPSKQDGLCPRNRGRGPVADGLADDCACRSGAGAHLARAAHRAMRRLEGRWLWLLGSGHLVLFAVVYWLAFALRFDFAITPVEMALVWQSLPCVLAVKFVVFFLLGHYEGWWAYVTFADLVALLRASVLAFFSIVVLDYFVLPYQIPRTVLILDSLLGVVFLGALRASWRLFREEFWPIFSRNGCRWAVVIGADRSNASLAHQIQAHPQLPYRIRGLLSLGDGHPVRRLGQIPVLGSLDELAELAAAAQVTDVLVTAGTLPGAKLREVMELCAETGLNLKIIRTLEDRLNGDHRIPIRDIEINDLLRRDPVKLDAENIGHLLEGRTVMVTGAGGSIGSEICRQVLRFRPAGLVLVGNNENPIFMAERSLRDLYPSAVLSVCIADVTDRDRMRQVFETHRPEVVFHAAAHKHVPMMETNPGEAIKNNVGGTRCLADLADEFGARNFVFISTDKAVHPSSIMGVSKHLAECYIHAMSQESATRFTVVRFGNVLGSDGSVVPIFQEQIRRGGPITVTDPRMTRFFMTIPEAAQLVLQAAAMGEGGEVFVLEMGEPVRIVDLARDLIRLSGLPENSIEIAFTGIRPGEKLYEELYFADEETLPTSHPKVRAAYHRPYTRAEVRQMFDELNRLVHAPPGALRQKLEDLVPEFRRANNDQTELSPDRGPHPTPTAPYPLEA